MMADNTIEMLEVTDEDDPTEMAAIFTDGDETVNLITEENLRKRKSDNQVNTSVEGAEKTVKLLAERKRVKRRIWKNIVLLGTAFMMNFSAYNGLQALQSSINCIEGLGFASLITVYTSLILSGLLLPSALIRLFGVKWTIVISMSCYVVYSLANFHPQWYTLIPASIIVGLAAAPLWTSESTYISTNAYIFVELSDSETPDGALSKFFGTFLALHHASGVVGNLISATVYRQLLTPDQSHHVESGLVYTCGASDCRDTEGNTTTYCNPPPQSITTVIIFIYVAIGVSAVLLVTFLVDKLPREKEKIRDAPVLDATIATVKLWKNHKLWMVVPMIMSCGVRMGVISGDFNESFVSCGIGVEYVGYITMSTSIVTVLVAFMSGRITPYIGRVSQMTFGMVVDFFLITAMLLWKPNDQVAIYFFIAAGWGITDALIYVQIQSFLGVLFPDHLPAAFANFILWNAFGAAVSFAMSLVLCVSTILYILIVIQLTALILYITLEYIHHKNKETI